MKIIGIETHQIRVPCSIGAPPVELTGIDWHALQTLFVRVVTDEGIEGWGEGFGHGACSATRAAIDTQIAPALLGQDAGDCAELMRSVAQTFHLFGRNGPIVYGLSALDIALWDILGKVSGQPLWRLLGGASSRTHLESYASLLRYSDPHEVGAAVERAGGEGYQQIKLHEVTESAVEAARDAAGNGVPLMVDANCPWGIDDAVSVARLLLKYQIEWFEEPVWPPEDYKALAQVRSKVDMPIAAGENAGGLFDFRHMFEVGAVNIAQPSVTKIGGVTEFLKIAKLAEAFSVRLVPHCAYFGAGYLASLHLAAALAPDAAFERLFLEQEANPYHDAVVAVDGRVAVPDGPGLGFDPDLAILARYQVSPPTVHRL